MRYVGMRYVGLPFLATYSSSSENWDCLHVLLKTYSSPNIFKSPTLSTILRYLSLAPTLNQSINIHLIVPSLPLLTEVSIYSSQRTRKQPPHWCYPATTMESTTARTQDLIKGSNEYVGKGLAEYDGMWSGMESPFKWMSEVLICLRFGMKGPIYSSLFDNSLRKTVKARKAEIHAHTPPEYFDHI